MEWDDYFAAMDPTNGEKLSGEFHAVLDAPMSPKVKGDVQMEVNFSLCEVLNFSGEPVRELCADLIELSRAVEDEASVALDRLGASGPLSITELRFHRPDEDPLPGWSPAHPKFNSRFVARCAKTGLKLSGKVRGRFVGLAPDDAYISDAVGDGLSRLMADAEEGVVAFMRNIHQVNDALSEELAPLLELVDARGFVVIEGAEYDEASREALDAYHQDEQPVDS